MKALRGETLTKKMLGRQGYSQIRINLRSVQDPEIQREDSFVDVANLQISKQCEKNKKHLCIQKEAEAGINQISWCNWKVGNSQGNCTWEYVLPKLQCYFLCFCICSKNLPMLVLILNFLNFDVCDPAHKFFCH